MLYLLNVKCFWISMLDSGIKDWNRYEISLLKLDINPSHRLQPFKAGPPTRHASGFGTPQVWFWLVSNISWVTKHRCWKIFNHFLVEWSVWRQRSVPCFCWSSWYSERALLNRVIQRTMEANVTFESCKALCLDGSFFTNSTLCKPSKVENDVALA